jgi:hypothetical protein
MNWISALKQFNANSNTWCVPKKGTPEYMKVRDIMAGKKQEKKETEYYSKDQIFPALDKLMNNSKIYDKLYSFDYHSEKMDYLMGLDKRIPKDLTKFYNVPAKKFFPYGLY